ncbi:MAG: cupin domain-containing protein [Vicinamibacterales bacterium]
MIAGSIARGATAAFAVALAAAVTLPAAGPSILRFQPEGPAGVGLKASGRTQSHTYFRSPANERTGVWHAEPSTTGPHTPAYSEFMYLLEGSVTLIDADGRHDTFKAGDAVLVPRGTTYTWQQTEPLRKYYAIFDLGPAGRAPAARASWVRLEADGPSGQGLTGEGRTKSHRYFAGGGKSSVGVWETAPHTSAGFHTTKYGELMVFLSGSGTLLTPDGGGQPFAAGDVVFVPRGAAYKWQSDRVRKFWVIFDNPAAATE